MTLQPGFLACLLDQARAALEIDRKADIERVTHVATAPDDGPDRLRRDHGPPLQDLSRDLTRTHSLSQAGLAQRLRLLRSPVDPSGLNPQVHLAERKLRGDSDSSTVDFEDFAWNRVLAPPCRPDKRADVDQHAISCLNVHLALYV
jgi:hypothetical protein